MKYFTINCSSIEGIHIYIRREKVLLRENEFLGSGGEQWSILTGVANSISQHTIIAQGVGKA